jgi:hypothetical protein
VLRLLVLLLAVANAGFFAWSAGFLAPYGFAPAVQSEPQRLSQQIRPEAMRIVSPPQGRRPVSAAPALVPATSASASSVEPQAATVAPASALVLASIQAPATASECLQAGLFNEEQTAVLRTQLQTLLPAGSWVLESSVEPARWIVYMGKYANAEAVARKQNELRQLKVAFEPLNNPALEPGLSLGSFAAQADADAELARLGKRGVHTARVIQALPGTRGQKLKLAAVSVGVRLQMEALKPQLAGRALQTCT